ncbi:type I-C CRISPR-associated protein Cas5 [Candidatus Desantisbacteria bacterium CG_4_10_14_0_8_um_filter_48_22]|uniref:pre-crRNA processing endonuclease n=1 Tax=Candidatus Desantisbacteria bacterium CG_4_10_14_0_8_um_filter_48_22 TaxID=1974543 RepID=A0A2M7SEE1_9BACT|nr:MAG: type I-C CRISPR-associated protein Cas5 [Candidatus Desantisbacteria bacterium CG_4_10_14_0_8_um_filter_48_22]
MIDMQIVSIKVMGEFACFTRPDLKVERMTYPCMTPSAARGILDCILWKPEFQWYVRKIQVLNPVQYFSIKRNEINSKQGRNPIIIEDKRAQRNSIVLKKVAYIIEASVYQKSISDKNPPVKYVEMFRRRVRKGQCWRRPYLGTREFSAEFMESDGTEKPICETIPIGSMLFDIFYDAKGHPEPIFFYDAAVKSGILDCEVPENEKMMHSSHIRPPLESEISAVIYDFNKEEEKEIAI